MNGFPLHRIDLNLLVVFEALMIERSVKLAADRLAKTPSTVSHALARLREQLDDPLLVCSNGKMVPSPYAVDLIEDVRPILLSISQVLQPSENFDPATSKRTFRISVFSMPGVISEVISRVSAEAPNVKIECVPRSPGIWEEVVEERVDVALLCAETPLPDRLSEQLIDPLHRYVIARTGHPAMKCWSRVAWQRWPHVIVDVSDRDNERVEDRLTQLGLHRRIGASVSGYAALSEIVASTDMLTNQQPIFLGDGLQQNKLKILEAPVPLPDLFLRFCWSKRLDKDPANKWIRSIVMTSLAAQQAQADDWIKTSKVVPARNLVPNAQIAPATAVADGPMAAAVKAAVLAPGSGG